MNLKSGVNKVGFLDSTEHIDYRFSQKVICKEVNYYLASVTLRPQGAEVKPSVRDFSVDKNTNKVHEHGFHPLQGGFKVKVNDDFEIFDQWVEVLPTYQVVAVEVKYDHKTGRQI
jgi:hypothetical protein